MPGFVTHYIFGVNAYKQIDNSDIHNNNVMRKMFLLIQNSNLTLLFYLFLVTRL